MFLSVLFLTYSDENKLFMKVIFTCWVYTKKFSPLCQCLIAIEKYPLLTSTLGG